jgi:glycosidase
MNKRVGAIRSIKRFLLVAILLIFGIISPVLQAAETDLRSIVFHFKPADPIKTDVFVAGTFNDWSGSRNPMTDPDGNGVYEATLFIPTGTYQYKFVVDGKWTTDVQAKAFADDGQGGKNSVIQVDESCPAIQFKTGDGSIQTADIPFRLDYSMVNPLSDHQIEFSAKAYQNDVERIELVYQTEQDAEKTVQMIPGDSDGLFQFYHQTLNMPDSAMIRFAFRYVDGEKTLYFASHEFQSTKPTQAEMFLYSPKTLKRFETPDWAKNGVFYQIFPDRFRNGDPSNDQDFHEAYYAGKTLLPPGGKTNDDYFHLIKDWNDIGGLSQSPYRTDGKPDYFSFYGGDVAGVMEKLPYLRDLGVTIIYFNPLNEARSNHKYDAVDYLKLDPHFADEVTFKRFTEKAHEAGIRVIVDMAFNHTGNWHFAFLDSKEKGPQSQYWNWYEWKKWPLPPEGAPFPCDYYACWWGYPIHPELNYDLSRPNDQENMVEDIAQAQPNWPVVNYVLEAPKYWIGTLGIDGFRLDVPNEVPLWFWKLFRKAVDDVKPDALLIGELWGNATPWLGPECFHSTMNYKFFREPVLKFFAQEESNAAEFDRELAPGRNLYPVQATQVMMNLIDSHDTERFLTVSQNSYKRLMLAALFQMTYVGIPQIYYGDEVGLAGGKDPDDRRPFPWDWEKSNTRRAVHDYYKKIVTFRHEFAALRTGTFQSILADGKVYAFVRQDADNRIVVILNNECRPKTVRLSLRRYGFPDVTRFKDVLNGRSWTSGKGQLRMTLNPLSGAVLVMEGK